MKCPFCIIQHWTQLRDEPKTVIKESIEQWWKNEPKKGIIKSVYYIPISAMTIWSPDSNPAYIKWYRESFPINGYQYLFAAKYFSFCWSWQIQFVVFFWQILFASAWLVRCFANRESSIYFFLYFSIWIGRGTM